jgi:transportin-3
MVLRMPTVSTHVAVRHSALRLMGELADWMDAQPGFLQRVLNWLLEALHEPQLANEAATALNNICSVCHTHLVPFLEGLVVIAQQMDAFALKANAANGILKGVTVVMNRLPPEQMQAQVRVVCWFQLAPLAATVQAHENGGGAPADGKNVLYVIC